MNPSVLLLILVAAGVAGVLGSPAAAGTPAARFWEQALPGTPMPKAIAQLVQKGIDHSPLKERYSAPYFLPSACLGYKYEVTCGPPDAMAATGIFFHEEKVRVGSVMTVSFPPADLPAILQRDVAARAPFGNITDVLATFSIAPGSAEAAMARETLRGCQTPPLAGERKACATSLEGIVQTAMRMLGTSAARGSRQVWAAASAQLPRDGLSRQPYSVTAVAALGGDRHVACHDEAFPYAVFQCHMKRESSTKAYTITLSALHGGSPAAVDMLAVCHLDTANWNSAHPAFEILHTKPGGAPVCHFMPYADLLFGEKAADA